MTAIADKGVLEDQSKENRELLSQIMAAIRGIKHGHIVITIHDSEVVQIDKTEKLRIRKARDCICHVSHPKTGGKTILKQN